MENESEISEGEDEPKLIEQDKEQMTEKSGSESEIDKPEDNEVYEQESKPKSPEEENKGEDKEDECYVDEQ